LGDSTRPSDDSAESGGQASAANAAIAATATPTSRAATCRGADSAESGGPTSVPLREHGGALAVSSANSAGVATAATGRTLLDEGVAPGRVEPATVPALVVASSRGPISVRTREPSVLHQRADATKRAFNRADALVSITQAYLRGDRPHRAPIEVMITIPASSLRNGAADPSMSAAWATHVSPRRLRDGSAAMLA